MTAIRITGFQWVPPFAQGLVRDLRVRWALEELGLPYSEKLLAPGEQNSAEHRAVQPFGQVPVFEEDGLTLFESGSILMHLGEKSAKLLPKDPAARARMTTWIFAALNSVEPQLLNLVQIDLFFPNEDWAKARRPAALKLVESRLEALAASLQGRQYFGDDFSIADILMTTVLRFLRHTTLVANYPALAAYQARCEARPAFQRALAAQLLPFEKYAPAA